MADDERSRDLAELYVRFGDDRLVLGHRLSEWCGHAPVLEEELALFRDASAFRNLLLVEQPNGDFAATIVRQYLFDVFDLHLATSLETSSDRELASFAARAAREAAYHARHSREWTLRLGDGTEESYRRTQTAIDDKICDALKPPDYCFLKIRLAS